MKLETERTIIKYPSKNDLEKFIEMSSDEEIARHIYNSRIPISKERLEQIFNSCMEVNGDNNDLIFFAGIYSKKSIDVLIGIIIHQETHGADSMLLSGLKYELVFGLEKRSRRRGIMTEVISAVTDYMKSIKIK